VYDRQRCEWLLVEQNTDYGHWQVNGRFETQEAVDRVVALVLAARNGDPS
jgi:hypothetical protein